MTADGKQGTDNYTPRFPEPSIWTEVSIEAEVLSAAGNESLIHGWQNPDE